MLLLLPPSEGKTDPSESSRSRAAAPLDLTSLSSPSLTAFRERVTEALVADCQAALTRPDTLAALREDLRLPASMDHEVARNAELFDTPAYPAHKIYTGVLFAAADFGSLSAAERRTANSRIRIASSLFGLVALNDKIPAYRLTAEAQLSGLSGSGLGATTMKSAWRKELDAKMPAMREAKEVPGGLIVDLRSGSYVAMWPIPKELDSQAITVKVWQHGPGNTKTAVSHVNKATKGELARLLATTTPAPRTFDDLVEICLLNSWDVQLNLAGRPQLDVFIRA